MPILYVAFVIIAVGVGLMLVNKFIPMQAQVKNLLNIVVVGLLVLWVILLVIGRLGTGPSI